MLVLFSEVSAIEDIYLSSDYPNWQALINNQTQIKLNITEEDLQERLEGDNNEGDPLFLWYHENMASCKPIGLGNQFQFVNQEAMLINEALGIYILNVDLTKANELSTKYGMLVFSNDDLIDISDFEIDEDFEKGEIIKCQSGTNKGYSHILSPFNSQKSNSTTIIDRNIFSNEQRGVNVGVDNLIKYFDSTLPSSLEINYDILVITQNTGKVSNQTQRSKIVKDLTEGIKALRNYAIDVEILIIHASTSIFEHTHQRRILKNYHFGSSEHGFDIFTVNSPAKVRGDNDFNLIIHNHSLFKTPPNQTSLKKRSKLHKRLVEIKSVAEKKLASQGQNDRFFRLYRNQNEAVEIKNRLIK